MAKKFHYDELPFWLHDYAKSLFLDYEQYSAWHLRLKDEAGTVCIDFWTTGKYYILETNFHRYRGMHIRERAGEKGKVNVKDKKKLYKWLDELFFPLEQM